MNTPCCRGLMPSSTWFHSENMCPIPIYCFLSVILRQALWILLPGTDPGPLIFGETRLGVLICYEVIFPQISRETVRRGAQVLMNLTNDAWYGDTGGPYQHLEIARWRAIEFRIPLVRAANTGISAIFDATGQECGRLALNTAGFLTCSVRPMSYLSFYAKYGDLFAWLCVFATFCAFVYEIVYLRILRRMSR